MRDDFAAFILTHGRPDRVQTYQSLRKAGYTGKTFLVIDDEDEYGDEYRARYGDEVVSFSKAAAALSFDEGDNFKERRGVVYARNACFDIAERLGLRYFVQLDDDYYWFGYRQGKNLAYGGWSIRNLDGVFEAFVRFMEETPTATIALSQGGDHIGGADGPIRLKRKAMNSFFCDVSRRFPFLGRINEDTTTYVALGHIGQLFFTMMSVQLDQKDTQSNASGMTGLYLDFGTYVKSFYSVMYAPSCVTVKDMGETDRRLHHHVDWNAAVPCIVREVHRKPREARDAAKTA